MAEALFNNANSLFVDENFEAALEAYTKAIEADDTKPEYYLKRSACHMKLKNYTDALADANAAIRLDPSNAQGYLRKGMAMFSLDEFETAKAAFEKGQSLDPSNSTWKTWIRKCDAELETENASSTSTSDQSKPAAASPASAAAAPAPAPVDTPAAPAPAPAPTRPALRHEWFQTATHVVLSVFAKGLKKEDVEVEFQERSVSLTIKQTATGSEFQHSWELFDSIVPEESSFWVGSVKIEIKLRKKSGIHWVCLEHVEVNGPLPTMHTPTVTGPPAYPSAKKKDWDKIANSIPEDKLEGEEALNKVFQDIFAKGTDDQRRAMMKSFVESGGTVLSTNWEDVGSRTVEGSPPKGMEMHKWTE